jgi:hypothetical protein
MTGDRAIQKWSTALEVKRTVINSGGSPESLTRSTWRARLSRVAMRECAMSLRTSKRRSREGGVMNVKSRSPWWVGTASFVIAAVLYVLGYQLVTGEPPGVRGAINPIAFVFVLVVSGLIAGLLRALVKKTVPQNVRRQDLPERSETGASQPRGDHWRSW